jgi:hypothetical protein
LFGATVVVEDSPDTRVVVVEELVGLVELVKLVDEGIDGVAVVKVEVVDGEEVEDEVEGGGVLAEGVAAESPWPDGLEEVVATGPVDAVVCAETGTTVVRATAISRPINSSERPFLINEPYAPSQRLG